MGESGRIANGGASQVKAQTSPQFGQAEQGVRSQAPRDGALDLIVHIVGDISGKPGRAKD